MRRKYLFALYINPALELMPKNIFLMERKISYFLHRVLGESISSGGAPNISCALALDLAESSRFL